MTDFAVYRREDLAPGSRLAGPALIEEGQTTTVVPVSFALHVDGAGYLVMESHAGRPTAAGEASDPRAGRAAAAGEASNHNV
jgi:N-methylhydantoinase A